MAEFPTTARVVIIGGGSVGASCLYHLAKIGWTDCVLLEKNELTSGSTWHAAGNCPNFSASFSIMKLQNYSTKLYQALAEEVDYPMNYHVTGAVRLAHTLERCREFERVVGMARWQGIEMNMLSVAELKDRYPYLETHDLEAGHWDPTDGDIDPAQLTQAFAKGARDMGAKIVRFCPVTGVRRENDEWVIETEQGEIRCEYVVNAAGYRAQEVGRMFGREIPQVTMAHQYLITEEIPELKARETMLPLLRDPDSSYYLRQEKHGLMLGPYEENCRAHWLDDKDPMPADFSFQLYEDDLERIEWHIEDACARVPLLGSVGVTRAINGPIPYAPDGNPLIGPMPGVPNAFEACVFTFGIIQAGGAGRILAEWVSEGQTDWDMWSCDPRRFTSFADQAYANAKGVEIYGHEYGMHFPHKEWPAARDKRLSPLHGRLKELGAVMGARAGWERAVYFGAPIDPPKVETWARQGPWFDIVKRECEAVRDAAGICDLAGFSRFQIHGTGTSTWLNGLITGRLPKLGRVGLVYFADAKGRIVTEMTLARHGHDEFTAITAAGAEWHDRDWLQAKLPPGHKITIRNETDDWDTLVLSGPKSRAILSEICDADLTRSWMSHQITMIDGRSVLLLRVSYVGELGWELHVMNDDASAVFETVWQAGQSHGLKLFGMYALESMRLEKGYRAWKQDLSTDYSLLEAGLERFIQFDKGDFIGRQSLQLQKQAGNAFAFATLTVAAGECDAPYLATIYDGDEPVGQVTSGGYGHRTGQSIALTVIREDRARAGQGLQVDIYGTQYSAIVQPQAAIYDAANERLRA